MNIINKSDWPDWFVKFVCRFVAAGEPKLEKDYTFTIRKPSSNRSPNYFRGTGWLNRQVTIQGRRFRPLKNQWPYTHGYYRYKWSKKFTYLNRVEHFIGLIAHEAHHATDGAPVRFKHWSKLSRTFRTDHASMEMACERAEFAAVERWRAGGAELRSRLRNAARKDRNRLAIRVKPKADTKLDDARKMLDKWLRKQKLANTKVRKYRAKITYYESRQLRVAAKGG